MTRPSVLAVGDSGLLVEFDNIISEAVSQQVLRLKQRLDAHACTGVLEVVASYRSLLIQYDCLRLSLDELHDHVQGLLVDDQTHELAHTHWRVPVCYQGEAAEDLDAVARFHQITTDEVIRWHLASEFRVYLVGFAPGWCYLGGLDPRLHTPRLESPRLKVPAGCISIGGQQGMIGGLSMPSGWRLLGQTPVKTYDPQRQQPFLIHAGDRVRFYPVDQAEYQRLAKAADQGEPVAEVISP